MKNSKVLAITCWASVIVLSWLFILEIIHSNVVNWLFFAFFLLLAIVSSAVSSKN